MFPLDPNGPFVENQPGAEFEDPKVRRRFIIRVFGLVILQLPFAVAIVAICLFVEDLRELLEEEKLILLLIAFLVYVVALFLIAHNRRVRHGPIGVICLVAVTVSVATMAALFSVDYSKWSPLFAASCTAMITLTICFVAACTYLDLTRFRVFVICFVLIGIGCAVIAGTVATMRELRWLELLGASVGALVFSVLLLYAMQTIMGGHAIAMKPDELIFAGSTVYVLMMVIYQYLVKFKYV